jgi:CheY-like chemotaxis protein
MNDSHDRTLETTAADAVAASEALLVAGDVFFTAKLRDTLKHLGIAARSVRTDADLEAALAASKPRLIIVDLAAQGLDAVAAVRRMKSEGGATGAIPMIAFAGHVAAERLAAASAAGADRVVTNGQISSNLPGLLADLGVIA